MKDFFKNLYIPHSELEHFLKQNTFDKCRQISYCRYFKKLRKYLDFCLIANCRFYQLKLKFLCCALICESKEWL